MRTLFLCALLAAAARGEIIDRIAVSVGNQVITESDLIREIRVTAFLEKVKPDLSPAGRRATAERMVEQKLIRRELETSRYPSPSPEEVDPLIEKFRKENFRDEADWQRSLAEDGITEKDVRNELLWQRSLLLFVGVRFRPGVQVSDQEIRDYFDKVVEPAARLAHPGEPVVLEEFRPLIENTLAGQRADREMDAWLKEARRRTEIAFHDEVFQ
jgi:peptidyl-prolyl cis-trans isomerase SurA